jgi:hypothetical protein
MVVPGELACVFQMNTNEDKAGLAIAYRFLATMWTPQHI